LKELFADKEFEIKIKNEFFLKNLLRKLTENDSKHVYRTEILLEK
jgi:hypothetical protein